MKFEKLNYNSGNVKKAFVIGIVVTLLFIVIINLFLTRAKYKLIESRKLASGTINYTLVDFELVEIKVKGLSDSEYSDASIIQDGNYELNQDMSYCTEKYTNEDDSFRDVKNESLKINFDRESKTISIKPYSKKGTKCYLFFDEKELEPSEQTLAQLKQDSQGPVNSFTGTSCDSGCDLQQNGIYEAEDDYGTSYYYRGTVDNNWVKFGTGKNKETGDIWWRIIRINGNGTIRLIYAGTTTSTPDPQGEATMIKPNQYAGHSSYPRAVMFNETSNDNKYVGYMYNDSPTTSTQASAHNVTSSSKNSTILDQIVYWYNNDTNLSTLSDKIDVETGFCSDTNLATGNHGSYTGNGYGTSQSGYAGLDRVWQANSTSWNSSEQTPTLKCGTDETSRKRDLYTGPSAKGGTKGSNGTSITGNNALPVPVGLITMDEVIYAGGFGGKANNGYWLYTNQDYWTMSPCYFGGGFAFVIRVNFNGAPGVEYVNLSIYGVRPVINLKADTKLTTSGGGTEGSRQNPYVVVTT